ncbi:MAG: radical SAM protein [Candidatus Thorarchaeota archaeon]|nr:radical SAM protein [Candidatus Thorarchaeota archaeon]
MRFARRDRQGRLLPPFPFDPVSLTQQTRRVVCRTEGNVTLRKYTSFYKAGVYGGIATAYSVGCNFRCVFCWVDWSRDWPEDFGVFCSPTQVYARLREVMREGGVRRARISGAEPTLCPDHLFAVLEMVHRDRDDFDLFVIETNGVVIATEDTVAETLARYASRKRSDETVGHVRLSIRGGWPKPFEEKTGCKGEYVDLPFLAAKRLWDAGVSFHVAVVVDPRFTSEEEKNEIYRRLGEIDPSVRRGVEEEYLDPYPHALVRLRAVGRTDVTGTEESNRERQARSRMPVEETGND